MQRRKADEGSEGRKVARESREGGWWGEGGEEHGGSLPHGLRLFGSGRRRPRRPAAIWLIGSMRFDKFCRFYSSSEGCEWEGTRFHGCGSRSSDLLPWFVASLMLAQCREHYSIDISSFMHSARLLR